MVVGRCVQLVVCNLLFGTWLCVVCSFILEICCIRFVDCCLFVLLIVCFVPDVVFGSSCVVCYSMFVLYCFLLVVCLFMGVCFLLRVD